MGAVSAKKQPEKRSMCGVRTLSIETTGFIIGNERSGESWIVCEPWRPAPGEQVSGATSFTII